MKQTFPNSLGGAKLIEQIKQIKKNNRFLSSSVLFESSHPEVDASRSSSGRVKSL